MLSDEGGVGTTSSSSSSLRRSRSSRGLRFAGGRDVRRGLVARSGADRPRVEAEIGRLAAVLRFAAARLLGRLVDFRALP